VRRRDRFRFHGTDSAVLRRTAQAASVLLLIAGCARAPVSLTGGAAGSGDKARARFLDAFAKREDASRGSGALSLKRDGASEGSMEVRWGTEADSMVVVGYVGPVRALDASYLGDSLYVALRPMDLGLTGSLFRDEGLGPHGLRFLARPWDFSPGWIRSAIEHGTVEPWGDGGWRVAGMIVGEGRTNPFGLELSAKGEPRRLRIGGAGGRGTLVTIRYGDPKSYRGGSLPRSVEWERGPAVIRLDIDEYARPGSSKLRHSPPADPEWTMLSLDDPRSRALLRRFLGIGDDEVEP
jgi:hypothetical protein